MRRPRFPANYPAVTGYGQQPVSEWQNGVTEHLRPLLASHDWLSRFATRLYYNDYTVQVYLDNWTLHFQVSRDGNEFDNPDNYGNLEGKALIAFDVEGGGRGIRSNDLKALQREIRTALRENGVYDRLGVSEEDAKEHHLVWETVDANDFDRIAQRIVEYMSVIYDTACPVLERLQNE